MFSPETRCPCSLPAQEIGESWNPQTVILAHPCAEDSIESELFNSELEMKEKDELLQIKDMLVAVVVIPVIPKHGKAKERKKNCVGW